MGKIKSAVITTIVVAAIVVLALFATISCTVPGSNGVKRYNSFISSIHLGSDLTGSAYTVLYPDGVVSAADYTFGIPEVDSGASEDEKKEQQDKQDEYIASYVQRGSVYVESEKLGDEEEFKANVRKDAEILSARLGEKGYSSYSVSVQDDFTIKVSVPTNFTYAQYKNYDSSGMSDETTKITNALTYLSYSGELTLRNTEVGITNNNILGAVNADVSAYFKSFKKYSRAGSYAIKVSLTDTGRAKIKEFSDKIVDNASSDTAIGFYVGDDQLLSLTVSETIDEKSFYITVNDADTAQDYAIILNSVANGNILTHDYNTDDMEIVYTGPALGDFAAVWLAVTLLAVLLAVIIFSVVRYKKLGLVNAVIVLIFAFAMVTAILLIEIQITLAGALAAVLGLMLLTGSNIALFEAVRKETEKGKTMSAAVKDGYKAMLSSILDMHLLLIGVSLLLAFVCAGELAACGLIFFIATVASYVLYWFTRFMWYVISSPVKDKFSFGGFKRRLNDD